MSNLRNGHVRCHYFSNFHVDFKMVSCRMSNLMNGPCYAVNIYVACQFKENCPGEGNGWSARDLVTIGSCRAED